MYREAMKTVNSTPEKVLSVEDTHINFDLLPYPLFQENSKKVDYGQKLDTWQRCQLCK